MRLHQIMYHTCMYLYISLNLSDLIVYHLYHLQITRCHYHTTDHVRTWGHDGERTRVRQGPCGQNNKIYSMDWCDIIKRNWTVIPSSRHQNGQTFFKPYMRPWPASRDCPRRLGTHTPVYLMVGTHTLLYLMVGTHTLLYFMVGTHTPVNNNNNDNNNAEINKYLSPMQNPGSSQCDTPPPPQHLPPVANEMTRADEFWHTRASLWCSGMSKIVNPCYFIATPTPLNPSPASLYGSAIVVEMIWRVWR